MTNFPLNILDLQFLGALIQPANELDGFALFLLVLGLVLGFVAQVWLIIAAFSVDLIWGLAVLCIPLVGLFFSLIHWDKAWAAAITGIFALVAITLGSWAAVQSDGETLHFIKAKAREQERLKNYFFKEVDFGKMPDSSPTATPARTNTTYSSGTRTGGSYNPPVYRPTPYEPADHSITVYETTEKNPVQAEPLITEGAAEQPQDDLIKATQRGDIEEVLKLVEGGTDINQQDNVGNTALMEAVAYGYSEIVQLLLAKGAKVSIKNNIQEDAFSIAEKNHRQDLLPFLEEYRNKQLEAESSPAPTLKEPLEEPLEEIQEPFPAESMQK